MSHPHEKNGERRFGEEFKNEKLMSWQAGRKQKTPAAVGIPDSLQSWWVVLLISHASFQFGQNRSGAVRPFIGAFVPQGGTFVPLFQFWVVSTCLCVISKVAEPASWSFFCE
jgi:hypothetical protein